MNCVTVLNINDILCNNARNSITSAALRWNVDFVEIKALEWSNLHSSFTKFALAKRLIGYDKVLYVDADILIRSDTPSPFELFPGIIFGSVLDIHLNLEFNSEEFKKFIHGLITTHMEVIKKNLDSTLDEVSFIKGFFNAGVLLFDPKVMALIFPNEIDISFDPLCKTMHYEQALCNWYIQKSGIPITHLDRTWNRIDPDINGEMKDYIYHFTGVRHNIKSILPYYSWKITH